MKKSYLIPVAVAVGSLYSSAAFAQPVAGPVDNPASAAQVAPVSPDAAAPAPAAPAPAAPAMSPTQIVDNEFPAYDLNKDGGLDETEFASWVMKLRAPAPEGATEQDAEAWAAGLFARADTDQDQAVSKTEMASLLSTARQG